MKVPLAMVVVIASCSDPRSLSEPCDACTVTIHPAGILDPTSTDFHGALLRRTNWNFATCAKCHGADFGGGTSNVSCYGCHRDGPTACVTCHGNGPTSNAHVPHSDARVDCAECHVVPTTWDQPGHILDERGLAITTPPAVVFGARANATLDPSDRTGPPGWDGTTCTNVYCHGAVLHAAGGTVTAPRWDDSTSAGGCTRCHAAPPPTPDHARTDCATCHPATAPHVDGIVQVGTGCNGCHGDETSPAPPRDLSGNTATTAIGVGAHRAHLEARSRLAAPIACVTCHLVPSTVSSPGHLDHALPVVDATLGWDRASQTCATAWCHGVARPAWTSSHEVVCGSCHPIPPNDAAHSTATSLATCATCHPQTVDAFGNILVEGGASTHINGVVDHL
ncbi:MAG: CxxxxCH/CxxCH domain-containing protein [Kofleriaceae bacterium]